MKDISARVELDRLEQDSVEWLDRLLRKAVIENVRAENREKREGTLSELANALVRQQSTADLLGRRRLYLETNDQDKKRTYAQYEIPEEETADEFLKKLEALLEDPAAKEIVEEHKKSRAGFIAGAVVLASSVIKKATKAVFRLIRRVVKGGKSRDDAEAMVVKALEGRDPTVTVTKSYAETVFKTNLNTAYTKARTQQAATAAFRNKVLAWRYATMEDDRVRDNHAAAHGFIAHVTDPIWKKLSPPMGFNCRCVLEPVSGDVARRARAVSDSGLALYKLAPLGAHPDIGFQARGSGIGSNS